MVLHYEIGKIKFKFSNKFLVPSSSLCISVKNNNKNCQQPQHKTKNIRRTLPRLTLSVSGESIAMISVVRSSGFAVLASLACNMSRAWKDISLSTKVPINETLQHNVITD